METRSISIEDLKECKKAMERKIQTAVTNAMNEFRDVTGIPTTEVAISITDISSIGDDGPVHAVTCVSATIDHGLGR